MKLERKVISYPLVHPSKTIDIGADFDHIVKGDGIYVEDANGKVYIDAVSGVWNVCLGYNNKAINDAINKQMNQLPFVNLFNYNNPTTLEFSQRLIDITSNNYKKVVYTCTGSESLEVAIKIGRKYFSLKGKKNKYKFITLDISYHGTTYAAMSASGIDSDLIDDYQPVVPGFIHTPYMIEDCCLPENICVECLNKKVKFIEEILQREGNEVAGIILEPIMGSGGVIELPKEYLSRIKDLCNQYDVLLIFDEVVTGFGRTGKMFGYEHNNIVPDIICFGKGISNGYIPLGAVLFNDKIYNLLSLSNSYIEHYSTQNGSPLACAAGIATLNYILENKLVESIERKGYFLKKILKEKLQNHRHVLDIRGKGLMIAIELVISKNSKRRLNTKQLKYVEAKLKNKGLLVYLFNVGNIASGISLFPAYTTSDDELGEIANIISAVFNKTNF